MHSSVSSTPSSDSTNKFSFPPGTVIDPIEIVHIFDHASEKFLLLPSLQERISNPERRKFILDIIDRVRQLSISTSISSSSTMKNSTIMMPENLQRNFITVALPEILQSIPPANLKRQGVQHFGQIHENNHKFTDDNLDHDVENSKKDDEGRASPKTRSSPSCVCPCCQMRSAVSSVRKTTSCACVARRIFISGKNGATNLSLLKHHGITHFVKCCELMPKHNSVDFVKDVLESISLKRETEIFFAEDEDCSPSDAENINKNNTKPANSKSDPGDDSENDEIFLDVGMKDDDKLSDGILKTFDRVLEFVKSKLRQSHSPSSSSKSSDSSTNDTKILIFCQAGKHRSAWCSAAVLAALSRDPSFACPCLIERTRYHSSLMYSVCYSIVKQCRSFVDFSPTAEENISRWIDERKLKTYHLDGAEESDDDEDEEHNE